MDTFKDILSIILSLVAVGSVVWGYVGKFGKFQECFKCMVRNDILNIYNAHKDTKRLTRDEYENITMLYNAYLSMKGNSFVIRLMKEVEEWEIEELN